MLRRSNEYEMHLPGELGIWILILFDMSVFALLFSAFVFYRQQDLALFTASQQALSSPTGLANTFLLLTSSWLVVRGVQRAKENRRPFNPHWFGGALLCAVAFVVNKGFEYGTKIHAGITPLTNDFFMYYYILTGIHLMHVVIGIGVLAFLRAKSKTGFNTPNSIILLEGGACYWHMVDLLWIVLFPLLYLMR